MSGKRLWLLAGLALLLAACGGQTGGGGGGGGGGASPGDAFAVLYEGLGTKALAVVSGSPPVSVSVQGIKKGSFLYVAGFRQGDYQDGLQDAMVWMLDDQGQVVAKKRIGTEMMPGYGSGMVRVNDRAYALALHGGYLYVAGYLAGCDDTNQDTCGGYPFVAKLNPGNLDYVEGFGGNSNPGFGQPGVMVLNQISYERTYAYALAVDDAGVYVGGFGGTRGFVAILDPSTGQERQRLVLGSADPQAKTHVEALQVQGGSLYVAGHTNVPFDCQGNPTGPVDQETVGFILKFSASDLTCDGGFGQGGVLFVWNPGDSDVEILSLALTQDGTRLLAAGFSGEVIAEGDTSVEFEGLLRGWVVDASTGRWGFFPTLDEYPYTLGANCQVRGQVNHEVVCADRARGIHMASDGTILLVGHVKGQVQAQDRFPGTEDGLAGSNLFFARYRVDGTRLAYQEVDFSGGTELGFGVVRGPGGYFYVVGSTTGPVGGLTNTNLKAIVLRFGP